MSKPKYKAHYCTEMEDLVFVFKFTQTRTHQELWVKPWPDELGDCIIHFPNFCPFCGQRLLVAKKPYGVPK